MGAKLFFLLIICCFSACIGLCQSTVRLSFNKKISIDEGLSSYNIKKILQDKYGFTWIVTQDGLNRYDGKSFQVYNKSMEPDHQLLASDVWDIEEDTDRDILWVITPYGGLNGINLKTGKLCRTLLAKQGFNNEALRCMRLYKDELWIGTYDGLTIYNVVSKTFGQFEPIPFKKNPGSNFCIDKIFIDRYENTWLFIANYGVVVYSCKTKKIINAGSLMSLTLENKPTYRQFNSVLAMHDGTLLTATNQGFRRINFSKAGITGVSTGLFSSEPDFSHSNIEACGIDSSRDIWFSTSSKLFKANINHQAVQEVKDVSIHLQNDWFNYIYDIFFDGSNNIWLGTRKGIAYAKNTNPAFTPYYISEDQVKRIDHAFYIYPVTDTIVYACTETGLLKIDRNKNSIVSLATGRKYYFITKHPDNNLLVSSEDSFFVYTPGDGRFYGITRFYPELARLSYTSINSVCYAGDSLAVIGTETANGFYLWNYKKKTLRKFNEHLRVETPESNIVNTCYKDKRNRIWILGDKLITLYNLNTQEVRSINLINRETNIPYNIYFDICEAGGYFWIAAYGSGLIQVDSNLTIKRVFTQKEGLSNTGVYKVFPVHDSLIFISTNYGLSVLNLNTRLFSNFYKEDGLNSNAFEEGCGAFKNERIYLGGVNGFTVIDPKYFMINNISPKLYPDHIRIETKSGFIDTSDVLLGFLEIPSDILQTTVSFSGLNYPNPSRTIFAYKIKELNGNWINLGTQNFVTLIGLSPGKHTLLVRSANENNVWNEKPLEITLIYLPRWYQTLLFKILAAVAIMALFYAIYAYRISQLKKQQQIRKEISADLHDDIGGILEGTKIFTHLAKREPHRPEHLIRIEESLKEAIAAFRDVIWILDDKQDTVSQFTERIKKFAGPVIAANNIHLQCTVEEGLNEKTFSKTEKRHLLMIVKESINNSIKYADCKNVTVSIKLVNNKMTILIEDDGKGFDVNIASEGNGLKNMIYRAAEIGYRVDVSSSQGGGSRVNMMKI